MVKRAIFCIAESLHAADHWVVSETLHKAQVGRRLRATIEALGVTQADVGKNFGVSPSKLSNWLRGDNYPNAWFVNGFCERYGITTDWLYRGIVSGIANAGLADALWKTEQAALKTDRVASSERLPKRPKTSPKQSVPSPAPQRRASGCGVPVPLVRGR